MKCSRKSADTPDMRSIPTVKVVDFAQSVMFVNYVNVHNRYWVNQSVLYGRADFFQFFSAC